MDWPLEVSLTGNWFSGPGSITVQAFTTGYYPLTFSPRREETVEVYIKHITYNVILSIGSIAFC